MRGNGSSMFIGLELRGPDTSLAGHIAAAAGSMFGAISFDEPLANVSYSANILRFSSENLGSIEAPVAPDGSTITFPGEGPTGPIVLERASSTSVYRLTPDEAELIKWVDGRWMLDNMGCVPIVGCTGNTSILTFSVNDTEISGELYSAVAFFGGSESSEEPLTDISADARSVSFSSETLGETTATVSTDGTELIMGEAVYTKIIPAE